MRMLHPNTREFLEWLGWMALFGVLIGATLWILCVQR
jgi:hypothetical protein